MRLLTCCTHVKASCFDLATACRQFAAVHVLAQARGILSRYLRQGSVKLLQKFQSEPIFLHDLFVCLSSSLMFVCGDAMDSSVQRPNCPHHFYLSASSLASESATIHRARIMNASIQHQHIISAAMHHQCILNAS